MCLKKRIFLISKNFANYFIKAKKCKRILTIKYNLDYNLFFIKLVLNTLKTFYSYFGLIKIFNYINQRGVKLPTYLLHMRFRFFFLFADCHFFSDKQPPSHFYYSNRFHHHYQNYLKSFSILFFYSHNQDHPSLIRICIPGSYYADSAMGPDSQHEIHEYMAS